MRGGGVLVMWNRGVGVLLRKDTEGPQDGRGEGAYLRGREKVENLGKGARNTTTGAVGSGQGHSEINLGCSVGQENCGQVFRKIYHDGGQDHRLKGKKKNTLNDKERTVLVNQIREPGREPCGMS